MAAKVGKVHEVRQLFSARADVNAKRNSVYERTALHHAAKTGSAAHVQALVDGQADLSMVDRNGKTPLHAAAGHRNGNVDKIRILVVHLNIMRFFICDAYTGLLEDLIDAHASDHHDCVSDHIVFLCHNQHLCILGILCWGK